MMVKKSHCWGLLLLPTLAVCLARGLPTEALRAQAVEPPEGLSAKLGAAETIRSLRVFPESQGERYLVVLTEPREKTLQHLPKLRIFRERDLREAYLREGFFVELSDWSGRDLNGDGFPEVVVEINNGGNCLECSRLEMLSLREDGIRPLYDSTASVLEDLNGDGFEEIVRTRYALGKADYQTLSHYDQITDVEILAWNGSDYAVQTAGYDDFLAARIKALQDEAGRQRGRSPRAAFSLAARILLSRLKIADCRQAWDEFWEALPDLQAHAGLRRLASRLEAEYGCP